MTRDTRKSDTQSWPEQVSLKNWGDLPASAQRPSQRNVALDCGWGRLIFGQTFEDPEQLAQTLTEEQPGERDVALYVREPHILLAAAPQSLFLDPSHTYRLSLGDLKKPKVDSDGLHVRRAVPDDERAINRLYSAWRMVPITGAAIAGATEEKPVRILVCCERSEDKERKKDRVAGVVMGVDHVMAFGDPDNGSSLWALAVDPQAPRPGVGKMLIETLAFELARDGRSFMDLSVMHDNKEAITLYEHIGFERVPVYAVKRKNPINENLFVGPESSSDLNIYADIIVREARRRGITVEIEDAAYGLFRLSHGGRSFSCRESLSDLTSAVAMSRCDDKSLTRRILAKAGLSVPAQISVDEDSGNVEAFLEKHQRVVVKPARGEQGQGVSVDLRTKEEVDAAIDNARKLCDQVLVEELVRGEDLRIIVIDDDVVAAAVRRPPEIRGDGKHPIRELIEKQSRRRMAATGGESKIPIDEETRRCIVDGGYDLDSVLAEGTSLTVRKTANLHTGGTIHDVTEELNPSLKSAAIKAAQELRIPVVGLDLIVPDPGQSTYSIIEANERPGLANHEPQPTAERFVDLLFPQTKGNWCAPNSGRRS